MAICMSLLTLIPPSSLAKELILDSLTSEALRANPDLKAAFARFNAEKLKAKAAGTLPDPTLGFAFSNLPIDSYQLNQTAMSGISVGITQRIPFPAKLSTKADIGDLTAAASGFSHKKLANRLIKGVKSGFYHLSYWRKVMGIITENIRLTEGLEKVAEAKYAAGEGLASDVLRAQTTVSQLRNRLVSAQKMYHTAEQLLLDLLNKPRDTHLGTPPDLPEKLPELHLDSLLNELKLLNPELKMAGVQVELAEKKKSLAKLSFWPDLSFGVDYRIREYTPMDPVKGTDFLSFRFGMSLPLWFFAKQKRLLNSADEGLLATHSEEDGILRKLEYEVIERYQEAERAREQFKLYQEAILPQAQSTLESSMIAYQVGKVDFLTLIISQLSVFNNEIEKQKTLQSFHQALADLEELTGSPFKGGLR